MALNPLNSSNLEQLALKGLKFVLCCHRGSSADWSVVVVVCIQPEFIFTQSGRVVHRRRTASADDDNVELTYEVTYFRSLLATCLPVMLRS